MNRNNYARSTIVTISMVYLRNMECVDKFSSVLGHKNPYNLFPFLKTWLPSYAEHLKIHNEIHAFTEV